MFIALSTCMTSYAQERISEGLEIDKTVHNFGDIMLDSGPVSCTFTLKNTGSKPAVIYNVTTTCGCTDVEWTREPIRPGGSGKIAVTYSNDEGPYPFDKSLTVYLSDVKKPVLLKLRGVCMEKQKPLTELYPETSLKTTFIGLSDVLATITASIFCPPCSRFPHLFRSFLRAKGPKLTG